MKRTNPFFSPLGLGMTFIVLFGLGLSIWRERGLAFSPGALSAQNRPGSAKQGFTSHADFEQQCRYCHEPLRLSMDDSCLQCHTEIADQLSGQEGIHGLIKNLPRCAVCHPDHRGRDYDMLQAASAGFEHSLTGFSLIKHQIGYDAAPLECAACHTGQNYAQVANNVCSDCHAAEAGDWMSIHQRDYGQDCLACHDGLDSMLTFDHQSTAFPLEGQHVGIACAACHMDSQMTGLALQCEGCHQEPALHQGLFEPSCAGCHSPQGWIPAILDGVAFDHALDTGFYLTQHQLDYSGAPITCVTCHPAGLEAFDLATCTQCHEGHDPAFMLEHTTNFGPACLDCHDGTDRMKDFDHARFFVLDGRHADLACGDCHADQIFAGTPTECFECHAEPEIHRGVFGLVCQDCHTTSAWTPASLKVHDFPLGHGLEGGQVSECATCHPSNYITYTCFGCHEHQPGEMRQEHDEVSFASTPFESCATCHPAGEKGEDD